MRPALLLVEDNPTEATLARAALTLHGAGMEVIEAADLEAAAEILARSDKLVVLAILGKRALVAHRAGLSIPTVAIAPELSAQEKQRAAAAGVRAVYERPLDWSGYSALVSRLLAEWLPTRKDSPPRPTPTS